MRGRPCRLLCTTQRIRKRISAHGIKVSAQTMSHLVAHSCWCVGVLVCWCVGVSVPWRLCLGFVWIPSEFCMKRNCSTGKYLRTPEPQNLSGISSAVVLFFLFSLSFRSRVGKEIRGDKVEEGKKKEGRKKKGKKEKKKKHGLGSKAGEASKRKRKRSTGEAPKIEP